MVIADNSGTPTGLAADRGLLGRTSTAERVAGVLRTRISEGFFLPGARLSEHDIGAALGVSRNTLREAFRLLTHERLLSHELNRGVFVRMLSRDDVVDLYRVRKLIECAAVRNAVKPDLSGLERAVADGLLAERREGWRDLGTANIHFHQALAALTASPRIDELMQGIFAELRLVFHVMTNPREFHQPYLLRNDEILDLLRAGDNRRAEAALASYLDDAERQLVSAFDAGS
ncbi:GntR family transcriptional regulator [Amycolatopsis sp. YIM 10]|uniref:GntR family transcriptional regulator n=1 Tax=Amycolatopsis sp. YIM 10 TaxID=2653857 RepID=UPI0012A9F677|nr:GntR family transcriptional regulator [Amycolatopsis sp. YIM 10]QFU87264.1 putative HTH-type transcriptional regulator YdfH [Amycolatopsis sp. YIM 10]